MQESNQTNNKIPNGMTAPMVMARHLSSFVGKDILKFVRQSWTSPEPYYEARRERYGLKRGDIFAKAGGWLDLTVSGEPGITLSVHEGAQSVNLEAITEINQDDETYPIRCDDLTYSNPYWASVNGAVIQDIQLHRANYSSGRPNLRAVSFKLDNGIWFAATYGVYRLPAPLILSKFEEIEATAPGLIVDSISVTNPLITHTDWGTWDYA